jgi:hypothetical protein
VVKDPHPSPIAIEQKHWQNLVAGLVISFEIFCCLVSLTTKSYFMLLIGVGGAIGFAMLFFNRQLREKYLGYQGDSSQPVASSTKFTTTPPPVEQSLLLWAMVVLLALTTFISLDLATHTAFSFLAIPFGMAGSIWSYRRRYLTKHPLTYLASTLAIMLVLTCLGSAFWGQMIEKAKNFLGSDRDLVLPLAVSFLLVAVQVARMWTLGYQRGLASSVVISTMLMVGTVLIGNNFGFLLLLAIFMGLLVPTLMLFYRSKINLKPIGLSIVPRPQQLTERQVPWKYLNKIAIVSMILGCVLSLFAPQLRLPDVSWDLSGVDQIIKNLPIQTDPDLANPDIRKAAEMEGITGDKSAGAGNSTAKRNAGNGGNIGQNQGDNQPGITGSPNLGGVGSQPSDSNNSEVINERLARQAIQNILATADQPLSTKAERKAYVQKYLKEHIQSPDCGSNNTYCFNSSLSNYFKSARSTDQHQTGLARWTPTAQLSLRPYYVAQQQISPPLLRQLTTPCPVNQQDCYKNKVFQANRQESMEIHNRLLRSIGGIDLTEDDLYNQSGNQGSRSSGNSKGDNQGLGAARNSDGQGGSASSNIPGGQSGNQGFGSPRNSDRQGGSQGSASSNSPGAQGGNQGLGAFRNSDGQVGSQGSASFNSSGEQSDRAGSRLPWSSPKGQNIDRGASSSGSDSNRQNSSQDSGDSGDKNGIQRNGVTGKSSPIAPDQSQKNTPINTKHPDRAKGQPADSSGHPDARKIPQQPPKLPPVNAEQLTNLLRIAVVILMLVAGVIWYLWLQGRQEKVVRQKEHKFNQLPTIERIYWLMLKELRTSGSIKYNNETEWEFALSKTQKLHGNNLQYPGLLGKLIVEISGDYVAWRYGKKAPNDNNLNHKFKQFRELHSEFYAAKQAKHKAASSIISQAKKTFDPVK